MAQQHYVGKKHRKQETKLKLMAHYGRLADPAVTDSSGKLGQGFTPGARRTTGLCFSSLGPEAGMANTNVCRSQTENLTKGKSQEGKWSVKEWHVSPSRL